MDTAPETVIADAARDAGAPSPWRGRLARAGGLAWLAVLAFALYQLHHEWAGFGFADFEAALARVGPRHIALALAFTAGSYLCNAALGLIAERWLKLPPGQPFRDLAKNLVVGAFTMNAGGSVVGGGSIRLRFAAERGIRAADVGKVTLYSGLAGWTGHLLLTGLLMIFAAPPLDWLPGHWSGGIGAGLVVVAVLATFAGLRWPRLFPSPGIAWLTTLVAALDWFFAGMAMWAIVPGDLPMNPLSLVAIVVVAQAFAALTHVPGGIGVLELALTKALAGSIASPVLAGALVTYRLVYYLLPFGTAVVLLGVVELRRHRGAVSHGRKLAAKGWNAIAPRLAALLALAGGFILMLSANTPMAIDRRGIVELLPLPFVEASHFISSLAGALLVVLAHGLRRRVRTAWWLSMLALSGGVVFSLAKGFDWEEALALSFLLLCLATSRKHFHRHAALWTHRFTATWWLVIATLTGLAIWVGFFAARHVPYQSDLWWGFALEGDASRFLRATTGAVCLLLVVGIAQALRPSRPRLPSVVDAARIDGLVKASPRTEAALAWLGDKEFTLSDDGTCGLMHADQGRSRIVMGDPLGDTEKADDLLWDFIEQARDEGMRPVFYQISVAEMPRLVDMGLKLYKLGEEAIVPLAEFSLEGPAAKKLRQARSRFQRNGLRFTIWQPGETAARISELRAVSDAWLANHHAGEKGFSLGRFDEAYLRRFSCAVVQDEADRVVAFANLWTSAGKTELSLDLMRHTPGAPNGVMEAMFVEIILWGNAQGYGSFNLGMSPLSGLSTHPLAPLWNKLGSGLFHRGGRFYNFGGLRDYKEKFNPRWEPRYLALPTAWGLPAALLDVTILIGGGLRSTLSNK